MSAPQRLVASLPKPKLGYGLVKTGAINAAACFTSPAGPAFLAFQANTADAVKTGLLDGTLKFSEKLGVANEPQGKTRSHHQHRR
jgi:hypothetical protein